MKKPAHREEVKLKKTSINLSEEVWRRFRSQLILEGREAGTVLGELIEEFLRQREKSGRHGSR